MKQNFIGFGRLEDWRAAIDPARTVNAESVNRPGRSNGMGISYVSQYVVLSQVDTDGQVLYWQMRTGAFESLDGSIPAFAVQKHHDRALSAWDAVLAWLTEQGLDSRRAMVACPRSLQMLDGHTDLLRYDQAADLWLRVPEPEPAVAAV